MTNPWDALSKKFSKNNDVTKIDPDAADNILIAWPPIIKLLRNSFENVNDLTALDYGCGTGSFCDKLKECGFESVTGIDTSPAMIKVANESSSKQINYICGNTDSIPENTSFDVITGIMVFQFVEDIKNTFKKLIACLKPGGLFVFAVHNPATVVANIERNNGLFSDFTFVSGDGFGKINLGGVSIPIFIRTANEFDTIFSKLGFYKVLEEYPPFTEEFLKVYGSESPDVPHFLILGYKKI